MKLSIKIMLSMAAACSFGVNATANGFYLSGKVGSSFVQLSNQSWNVYGQETVDKYQGGNDIKSVFSGGVAIGYDFYQEYNLPIRTEFDVVMRGKAASHYNLITDMSGSPRTGGYLASEDAKNEVKLNTFMINTYYDFKNSSAFTPYISLGFGLAKIKQKSTDEYKKVHYPGNHTEYSAESKSQFSNNLAWSLGVGGQYKVSDQIALDISYRYLNAGKSSVKTDDEVPEASKLKASTSDLMFGVIYRF